MGPRAVIDGFVAPGFEEVRDVFERNFVKRGEIGAAVAAYWRGERVVDLWGGRRAPAGDEPWNEDTMVVVMSTTKGLSAMTLAIANARGWLDYETPVVTYWPGLAARYAARLPHDYHWALHAGADPACGSGASLAGTLLPGGDRAAARARLLHRAAARHPGAASCDDQASVAGARDPRAAFRAAPHHAENDRAGLAAAPLVHGARCRSQRSPVPRGRGTGGERRGDGACDCAGLFRVRARRRRARHHAGDVRPRDGPDAGLGLSKKVGTANSGTGAPV